MNTTQHCHGPFQDAIAHLILHRKKAPYWVAAKYDLTMTEVWEILRTFKKSPLWEPKP